MGPPASEDLSELGPYFHNVSYGFIVVGGTVVWFHQSKESVLFPVCLHCLPQQSSFPTPFLVVYSCLTIIIFQCHFCFYGLLCMHNVITSLHS
jgi:hypothetical protein